MSDSDRHDQSDPGVGALPEDGGAPSEQRSSFLGFVAHEMRNPLSTALWSAELLVRLPASERGGARGDKLAGMCLRSLQRLRYLVEDHFLSERLEVGGIPIRWEEVPLRQVVDGVAGKPHSPQVSTEIEPALTVWADRGLVERAVEALVSVAGKGPVEVRVDARRGDGRVELRVHGAPPAADALVSPQKGTASDPTGHALSLHMAGRVADTLGGALSILADGGYCLSLRTKPAGQAQRAP